MRIQSFQALYPKMDLVTSPFSFFSTMKNQYPQYFKSGFFKRSSREALYVYQIRSRKAIHVGIIASTDIRDVDENKVLKHENTLAAKEQNMMHLMLERQAMIKPVLLAYDKVKEIDRFTDKVIKSRKPNLKLRFEEEGQWHSLWQIHDAEEIEKLTNWFDKKISHCYIADGHHRCSTTSKLLKTDQVEIKQNHSSILSVYFPFDQLAIYDYNRVVDMFAYVSPFEFIIALSKYANIEKLAKASKPNEKFEMTMFAQGNWYKIRWKKKLLKKHEGDQVLLDASLFNEYILKNILGVEDVRSDERIKYVEGTLGTEGLKEKVLKKNENVGFCLFPVHKSELIDVANASEELPPKSTWFEPRIKNGLIIQEF